MLVNFKVKNFMAFSDWEDISFLANNRVKDHEKSLISINNLNLLPVKGIAGMNGAGKSSLIRAIFCYYTLQKFGSLALFNDTSMNVINYFMGEHEDSQNWWEGSNMLFTSNMFNDAAKNILFEVTFAIEDFFFVHFLELDADLNIINEKITIKKDIKDDGNWLTSLLSNKGTIFMFLKKISTTNIENFISKSVDIFKVSSVKVYEKIPAICKFLDNFIEQKMVFGQIMNSPNHFDRAKAQLKKYFSNSEMEKLITMIAKTADSKILSAHKNLTPSFRGKDNYEITLKLNNGEKTIAYKDLSVGTKKFVKIVMFAIYTVLEGGLFIGDELDMNLHPSLSKFIIDLFMNSEINKKYGQFLFTSHVPYSFDELRIDQIALLYNDDLKKNKLRELLELKKDLDVNLRSSIVFSKNYLSEVLGEHPKTADLSAIQEVLKNIERR
ncbi:AAA family ATPase [Spiroplasma endosymbiont of Labia minor]|uniref:AAA family ATPase n=1 Tax=Spiroplasma endosymbiont of Labia minor TaxID=3066305 RepID=UPI0030CE67BE